MEEENVERELESNDWKKSREKRQWKIMTRNGCKQDVTQERYNTQYYAGDYSSMQNRNPTYTE